MNGQEGIFIPMEVVHAFISAAMLIGMLFVVGCIVYYVCHGLRKLVNWLRMSKIERAKAYLRTHDPDFRRREQIQVLARRARAKFAKRSQPLRFADFDLSKQRKQM
jgi:hypothetical protein